MFANVLAAALRNLMRNRLYAAISILSLAIGMAAALLTFLYVRDERSGISWSATPAPTRARSVRLAHHPQFIQTAMIDHDWSGLRVRADP